MPPKGPRYDRISAPDKIIDAPDLKPQAEIVGSPYASPTKRNVAEVPQENQLMQLASGLSAIEPSFQLGVAHGAQKYTEQEGAKAEADQATHRVELKDAIAKGLIQPGQSRAYEDMYNRMDLKDKATKFSADLYQQYSTQPEVYGSDKQADFEAFASKAKEQFAKDNLLNGETAKYSPLDIAKSGFNQTLDEAVHQLRTHHTNYRIDERTKKGEDIVGRAIADTIKQAYAPNPDGSPKVLTDREKKNVATSIDQIGFNELSGAHPFGGMKASEVRKLQIGTVMATAIEARNMDIVRDIGQHLGITESQTTDKVGNVIPTLDESKAIKGTKDWIAQAAVTREHIAGEIATDAARLEARLKISVAGTPAQRVAQYGQELEASKSVTSKTLLANYTHAAMLEILKDADPQAISPERFAERTAQIQELRKHDPESAAGVEKQILTYGEHKTEAVNKKNFPVMEAYLRNDINRHPGPEVAKQIDQALYDEVISGEEHRRLQDHNDKMLNADLRFGGLLKGKGFTDMLSAVGGGAVKDVYAFGGAESIAKGNAETDLRLQGIDWLEKNNGASEAMFLQAMQPLMKPTAERHNQTLDEARKADEETAKTRETVQKLALKETEADAIMKNEGAGKVNKHGEKFNQTPADTRQVMKATAQEKSMNKGPAPEKLAEYMTTDEKKAMVSAIRQAYEPGIDTKPISQGVMRDRIREVLSKHYSDPHELNDAVTKSIAAFSAKYTKKK